MREPPRRLDAVLDLGNPDIYNVKIFLDGDCVRECVSYDAEAGWIEQFAKDYRGKLLVCGDEFKIIRKRGKVRVTWICPEKVV
jgi:hypothetical protein